MKCPQLSKPEGGKEPKLHRDRTEKKTLEEAVSVGGASSPLARPNQ